MMNEDDPRLKFLPFDEVTKQRGVTTTYNDYWWAVHPEKGLVFFNQRDYSSPQCNRDKNVVDYIIPKLYPWAQARQISAVNIPAKWDQYD